MSDASIRLLMTGILRGALLYCALAFVLNGQETGPTVTAAAVPFYPPLPRAARIQGAVVLKVKVEGGTVKNVQVLGGHSLLRDAAVANVKTWRFNSDSIQELKIAFHYILDAGWCKGNPSVQLNFPYDVRVCAPGMIAMP